MKTKVDLRVNKPTDSSVVITATDHISKACLTTIFGASDSVLLLTIDDRGGRVTTTFETKDIHNNYKSPYPETDIRTHMSSGNYSPLIQDVIANTANENIYQSVGSALSRLVAIESNDVVSGSFVSVDEANHVCATGYYTEDFSMARGSECLIRDARVIANNIKNIKEAVNETQVADAVKGIVSVVLEPVLYGINDYSILKVMEDRIGKAATDVIKERISDKLPWE